MAKKITAPKTPRAPARTAVKAAAPKKPRFAVSIDYPQENEAVRPGHYSVRLTATGASQVQARVAGGDWLDCREAVGHFWLDWSPRGGETALEARARAGKGRWTAAVSRSVSIADA